MYKARISSIPGRTFVLFQQQIVEADDNIEDVISSLQKFAPRLSMSISVGGFVS